jgi:hypothetical protein
MVAERREVLADGAGVCDHATEAPALLAQRQRQEEIYGIIKLSFPQPSPRSQFKSIIFMDKIFKPEFTGGLKL